MWCFFLNESKKMNKFDNKIIQNIKYIFSSMTDKTTISIIGAGNVASHLANLFIKQPNIVLEQMYNRRIESLYSFKNRTEIIDDLSKLKSVDLLIFSVSDDAIESISDQLKGYKSLVVHTSGSVSMDSLKQKRRGVLYPFQTFTKEVESMDFSKIPILIEANYPNDLIFLEKLAKQFSSIVNSITSEQRLALHISGVFVANFVNRLYIEAERILKENNLPFDLVKPLILEVARKVQNFPANKSQTGPASRGDVKTIKKHLNFLKDSKQKDLYQLLTEGIIQDSNNKKTAKK